MARRRLAPAAPSQAPSSLDCLAHTVHPTDLDRACTRYLTIHVARRLHRRDDHIALIGHELQHANEVLTAGWVRNDADAYALFTRIGSAESIRSFETAEAQRIGGVIAQELGARPRPRR